MSERNRRIDPEGMEKRSIEERLKDQPQLLARLQVLVAVVENAGNDWEKADDAERRVLEEVRQIGNEVLRGWAQRQQRKKANEALAQDAELKRQGKKT